MDAKLTILFLLIGTVIALSHLGEGKPGRVRRQLDSIRWRAFMPGWRGS
jgi:hypothetical protein